MIIRINGKAETIGKKEGLAALIADRGLCPDKIVVEHNLKIVDKADWPNITLSENDNIEIVSFVGGG